MKRKATDNNPYSIHHADTKLLQKGVCISRTVNLNPETSSEVETFTSAPDRNNKKREVEIEIEFNLFQVAGFVLIFWGILDMISN